MEPAPETLAGISVDAVREQLKQLGHDDVSDEVIREFLKQLSADAAFIETPAVAFASQDTQSTSSRPRRAERTTLSASKARAASALKLKAPSAPKEKEPTCVPTSPKALARKQASMSTPTSTMGRSATARGADGALVSPNIAPHTPSMTSSARRTTPGGASTSTSSKMSTPRTTHTPSKQRSAHTPSSVRSTFGTASRFGTPKASPAPSRPASACPRTRTVASSVDANARFVESKLFSVIRAPRETRGTKAGQFRVVDRVARAAQFAEAWRKDSFLRNGETRTEVRQQAAFVPRKLENFASKFASAQANTDACLLLAKKAQREREKVTREDWERHFEISRRAQVRLTDIGGTRKFQTPQDSRRDDVRWEVRRRMAAPPVL